MPEFIDKLRFVVKANYEQIALYIMLFIMLLLIIPNAGFAGDVGYWITWGGYIFENGLANVYQLGSNNYNPLYHYILYLFGALAGSMKNIGHYIHYLKAFTLVFDFAAAILAASLIKEKQKRFMLSLLLLFNAGYLYNTLAWEQVDAIFTCFSFIAVIAALRGKLTWSLVSYVLALNAKTQAIIFLPLLLLLWVPQWARSVKSFATSLVAAIVVQILVLAPFMWFGNQNDLARIIDINVNTVNFYPVVSMNSFNIWYWFISNKDLTLEPDNQLFWGITYKNWGLLMFMASAVIILLPVLLIAVRNFFTRQVFTTEQFATIFLSCGLIPVIFCYFNTQMHERYWHAAIIFLAAYSFLSRSYFVYIVCSAAYFFNLEKVLQYLKLRNYSILFMDPKFIAALFTIVLVAGIYQLYRRFPLKTYVADIRNVFSPKAMAGKQYV